jgi:hypothetical protein
MYGVWEYGLGFPRGWGASLVSELVVTAPAAATLTSVAWMDPSQRVPRPERPSAQEPAQPPGPLVPFVSSSLGWLSSGYRNPITHVAPALQPSQYLAAPAAGTSAAFIAWVTPDTRRVWTQRPQAQESSAPPLTPFTSPFFSSWTSADTRQSWHQRPQSQEAQAPINALTPFVAPSFISWATPDARRVWSQRPQAQEPSYVFPPIAALTLPSFAWFDGQYRVTPAKIQRQQEAYQPTGPLRPFVAPTFTDWSVPSRPVQPARPRIREVFAPVGNRFVVAFGGGPIWFLEHRHEPFRGKVHRPLAELPPTAIVLVPVYQDAPVHRYRYMPPEVRDVTGSGDHRAMSGGSEAYGMTAPAEAPRSMVGSEDIRDMVGPPDIRGIRS